jgi:hypothetical protein
MGPVCIVDDLVNNIQNNVAEKYVLWRIYDAGKSKMYIGLHVKWPKFFPDFNQIWNLYTDFHRNPQYQISRKSAQWEPR